MLRAARMRVSSAELRATGSLHRWLRRAALAAIPATALAGCGRQCDIPDADSTYPVDGGVPWATGSEHAPAECVPYCGATEQRDICFTLQITGCRVVSTSAIACHLHYTYCAERPCGRLPPGLKQVAHDEQHSLIAAHLAGAARLEGAAVIAFQILERELIAHGAPGELIGRARSARRDEMRHHAAVARLAARFGAHVDPVEVEAIPVRTLPEIAVENAVEGCVRETYGAAVAAFQGEWAQDGAIRRTMRAIAVDEAEHASLGWAIDSWVHPRLGAHERARVDLARHDAREGLVAQACAPVSPELSSIAGVPGTAASEQLIAALAPLWS